MTCQVQSVVQCPFLRYDGSTQALKYFNSTVETHLFKCLEVVEGVLTDLLDWIGVNNFAFLMRPFCVRKKPEVCDQRFNLMQYFSRQINQVID